MSNYEQYKRLIRFWISVLILTVEIGIYWIAWNHFFSEAAGTPFFRRGDWLMLAVYSILLLFFSKMYGGLKIGYLERGNILYSQILSVILVDIVTYLQIALLAKRFLNPFPFSLMFAAQAMAISIWTFLANFLFQKLFPPRQMLLIYGNRPSLSLMDKMNRRKDRYQIKDHIHVNEGLPKLKSLIPSYDAVVICDVSSSVRNQILKYCAALEVEEPSTFTEALDMAIDIDDYELISDSEREYGRQALRRMGANDEVLEAIEGCTDFDRLGSEMMDEDGVRQTGFGLVRRLSKPFPPEQEPDQQMGGLSC